MGAAVLPVWAAWLFFLIAGIVQSTRESASVHNWQPAQAFSIAVPTRVFQPPESRQAWTDPQPEQRVIRRVYRVTAYNDRGLTASGVLSGVGQCAAPADIPFGARVHIPALGRTLVVTDRTHRRFRHNTVDIFMPGYKQCRQFGRRYLECIVELPPKPYEYGSPELEQLVRSHAAGNR